MAFILGFMYYWGMEMCTASAILLSVGLGLAIDYSVHIAHAFIAAPGGSKDERVQRVIMDVGSAVFNGGFSTFLAFIILAFADSYGFTVFFKVFFLISVFGLYHGLVFLPIFLSMFGISEDQDQQEKTETIKEKTKETENPKY